MGGTHSIECNSAAKISGSFVIREICISESLILGKNNTMIRGGIANAGHISTSYKNLVEPPSDLFVSQLNAQVSCYASWRPDSGAT